MVQLFVSLFAIAALAEDESAFSYFGPNSVEVDLLRTKAGGNRIFVQAKLPDGERGLFLVDTGAAISEISASTADRLGLAIEENWGRVEGLGGSAPLHRAEVASLSIGDAVVPDVSFAVGVRGVPDRAGLMPLDGILGNNVWRRFVVEVDYPKDALRLHRPGTFRMPRRSDPMFFDGNHVFAPIEVTTEAEEPHHDRIIIQLDTGAGGLMLSGRTGKPFERDFTEGLEAVHGIGALETLPASMFLRRTRRIPVRDVTLGGRTIQLESFEARWLNFGDRPSVGPDGMQGLAGHELMRRHVAIFDYDGGRFALEKSRGKPRLLDGHQLLLEQDLARYGDDPARDLFRAKMNAWLDNYDAAQALLESYIEHAPEDAEGRVLLAAVHRHRGNLEGAWRALEPLSAGALVDENEVVAVVNGLLLEKRAEEAMRVAEAAVAERPDADASHVALADALLWQGDVQGANNQLLLAAALVENPDAYLLRRARVALARGDRYGSMAHVRRLLQLYPSGGIFLWFYSLLTEEEADALTFRSDMEEAVARLHPHDRPLDFLVAAHRALGDDEAVEQLMQAGIERDCSMTDQDASRDNCLAWYGALAQRDPTDALRRIDRAIEAEGMRSDYLDTKAMVHLALGEYDLAYESAIAAARLSPDDVYMLWQAERIAALAVRRDGSSVD